MTTPNAMMNSRAAGETTGLGAMLESALESLSYSVIVFDRRLNAVFQNQASRRIFGDVIELADALRRVAVESQFEDWKSELRKIADGGLSRQIDLTLRSADAGETVVSLSVHPVRASDGRPSGGVLIAEDVTQRISMERRLAVSERLAAVGKLAARVAHELNNPLDGILRFTNLSLRRMAEEPGLSADPKLKEYLDHVRSGIIRMRDIVSSLLEFSRTAPSKLEQATINKIVEDAISALEGRAQESHVAVICHFHQTDMPVVRGSSLFQVFCNLIKNAIDAMPQGGTLTITTQISGVDVVVRFEDTGVGLPDDVEKIFEPFYTTKPPGQGTGLGLAVCRELIEKYSGTITAERREPRGARFSVTVPTRNCAASPLGRDGFHAAMGRVRPGDSSLGV